jgi:hypothetical protein
VRTGRPGEFVDLPYEMRYIYIYHCIAYSGFAVTTIKEVTLRKQLRTWPKQRPSHWGNGDSFLGDKAAMFTTSMQSYKILRAASCFTLLTQHLTRRTALNTSQSSNTWRHLIPYRHQLNHTGEPYLDTSVCCFQVKEIHFTKPFALPCGECVLYRNKGEVHKTCM